MIAFASRRLLGSRADHVRLAAGLFDFGHGRLRKLMSFHRNAAGQLPGPEDLQSGARLLVEPAQVHDGEMLLENIGEAALRQATVQRHLAAFKTTLLAETRSGVLALGAARRRFPVSRAHAAPDALAFLPLPGRRPQSTQIHRKIS